MSRAKRALRSRIAKHSFTVVTQSRNFKVSDIQCLQKFDRLHLREAIKELLLGEQEIPESDKAKKKLIKKMIKHWTLPCYALDSNNIPVEFPSLYPQSRVLAQTFCVGLTKVSTAFLGVDHRFGRSDKGDEPILFETLVFPLFGEVSFGCVCSTYAEAMEQHMEIAKMVQKGKID